MGRFLNKLGTSVALGILVASFCGADIVINELHYAPVNKIDHTEFVEIYNDGASAVDIGGWRFSGAVDFQFPVNTVIAAGGYLVVGEEPAALNAQFGILALGPCVGYLDNDGERIRLRNAADEIVDEVDYGVGFPWPTASAGEGSSMELIHPALDNDLGGSWRASGYPGIGNPTPGQQNSVWSLNSPPQVRQVDHYPQQPATTNDVMVTVKVTDPDGVGAVELAFQVVLPGAYLPAWQALDRDSLLSSPNTSLPVNPDFTNAVNWTTVLMRDDGGAGDVIAGDDIYSVVLPAQSVNRTLLRYRITVRDVIGNSELSPLKDDPSLNFAYFVYDGVSAYSASTSVYGVPHTYSEELMNSLPVYQLLTRNDDLMHCYAYAPAYSTWQIPVSNESARDKFNWEGAFVYEGVVYDHVRYRARQRNDRYFGYGKRSMRFRFNKGRYLQTRDEYGRKALTKWRTLNTGKMSRYNSMGNFGLSEHLNQVLWNLMGVSCATTHHFHFRVVDGVEESPAGADGQYHGDFHGYGLAMENYDSRFMDARNLPDGNMYKLKDGVSDPAELQRNQGRHAVTDGSDFNAIRNNLRPERDAAWLDMYVDYERWYPYHAICEAVRHYDFDPASTHFKNRIWFFEPVAGNPYGRMRVMPHDSDASWIRGYHDSLTIAIGIDYPKQAIFDYLGGSGANAKPAFKQAYRNVIRELRDLLWREEVINPMIDELASRLQEFSYADRDRWTGAPVDAGYEDFGSMESWIATMKIFAFEEDLVNGESLTGGRAAYLDQLAAAEGDAAAIPDTPTIAYTGISNSPINGLTFTCSTFSDPQGEDTFAAMRWRVGEITDVNAPGYDLDDLPRYEIVPVWQSDDLTNYTAGITVPATALKVGHTYRARLRMQDSSGRWSHWSSPYELTTGEPDTAVELLDGLRVTEMMFHPADGAADGDDEFIEFQNIGTNVLSLEGILFTDGIDFTFGDISLDPGEFVVVVKDLAAFSLSYDTDGMLIAGEYDGKLKNEGESVKLRTAASGTTLVSFEYESGRGWPVAADGAGHSLVPLVMSEQLAALDYGGNWRASGLIGGSPGEPDSSPEPTVVINEFAAHTDYTGGEPWQDSNDWIELFNAGVGTVVFDGVWYLSDSPDDLRKWQVTSGTLLAGAWKTFYEVDGFHPSVGSGFGLDKSGEKIFLSYLPGTDADRVVDAFRFKGQRNGVTEGRYPDGAQSWHTLAPTADAANAIPEMHIMIEEIMYHPEPDSVTLEYIELYNPLAVSIPLWVTESLAWDPGWTQRWRIDGGVDYVFPVDTVIAAGERVLVVSFDPDDNTLSDQFRQAYGLTNVNLRLFGPYSGQLSDRGDRVALERPVAPDNSTSATAWEIIDEVIYFDRAPWPEEADAGGLPLQRAASVGWGCDPAVWVDALAATPGLPPLKAALVEPFGGDIFSFPCEIQIQAAVDPQFVVGTIDHIEFYANNESIGVVISEPYQLSFTPDSSNAIYRLEAVLFDDSGAYQIYPVTIEVIIPNSLNTMPYEESFERYDTGTVLDGVDGWVAPDPNQAVVVAEGSAWTADMPILDDQHDQSLAVHGEVVNQFESNGCKNVWFDMLVQANLEGPPWPEDLDGEVQFSLVFSPVGRMQLWQGGGGNSWIEVPDVTVTNSQWVRITIQGDYTGDTKGFRLWADGVAVTNPASFFPTANPDRIDFETIKFTGEYLIDDLVVDDYDLLNYRKVTTAAHGAGTVSPSGELLVPVGGEADIIFSASNYYHLATVDLDGASLWAGAVGQLTFGLSNVVSRHRLDGWFDENLAAYDTPEWWLAEMHPAWTNAFDDHALGDFDMDGHPTWAEYVAGTHPTNINDVLRLYLIPDHTGDAPAIELSWESCNGRGYSLYSSATLTGTVWDVIHHVDGQGGVLQYRDVQGVESTPQRFYKLGVQLNE